MSCGGSRTGADKGGLSRDEGRQLFAPGAEKGGATTTESAPDATTWSIVLALAANPAAGPDDPAIVEVLERIQTKGGLPEAYAQKRRRGTVIAYGKYQSAEDPKARADLNRIRSSVVDGGRPFADAFLSPPSGEALRGSNPEFDLRNARQTRKAKALLYTLQVAVYARPDRKAPTASEQAEFRAAAEKAAAELRADGELAFYYHGPNSSSVTVGVFSADEIDPKSASGISPALRDAREKHPYNLLNGNGINERVGVGPDGKPAFRLQAAALVTVPE